MIGVYAELHCHSAYSFLDGASLPEELAFQAHRLGLKALALTDHDGLYGSMEFAQAAKGWGVQPITGAEVTLEDGSHATLLVESAKGYANLCRLLSQAHLTSPKGSPKLPWEALLRRHEGLILLTGCRSGALSRLVAAGRFEEALETARRWREAFGPDRVFVELQHNLVHGDAKRIRGLVELARRLDLGIVATNNVHYHERSRHQLQDVLVAIKHRTTLDASHRLRRPNSEFYLKSPQEMARLFAELPGALRATVEISERCQEFDLTSDLGYTFPDFTKERGDETADAMLERVCREALERRYAGDPPALRRRAEERLQKELELVRRHGLSGFFLVYRDLMKLAEEAAEEVRGPSPARRAARLPPGRGRGSSVSSLICYLIGLSHVDPVQNNLSIDRFLSDELHVVPDIDLDFARDIREALIQKVYAHYGREYAALVCSFSTYRLRSAVRDVGKALGLPAADLAKLAKSSDALSGEGVRAAMLALPELAGKVDAPLWRDLIRLAGEISGFPRHITQHVGGMIISSRPLVECVPIEPARMPGRFVCQWDKDSCEDARFIKVDFLGLGMLSLVEECVELIYEGKGEAVDLSRIPFDDEEVYDQICAGDTIGVFQIESRAQIQLLPRTQPRSLDELAIEIAIIRPGPIIGGAVHPYVSRRMAKRQAERRGEEYRCEYDHPLLEPVLEETLGVILYQDQVLQTAVVLAGFTPGQAEALRRALGRRRSKEAVERLRAAFREGAERRGVPAEVAERVFEKIAAFSLFGFPKAHAYAFAVLAYQSAWLRRHYPAEYLAALFNSQPMGFYPPHALVQDAKRRGVEVLPPDVNHSGVACTVEVLPSGARAVRIGLGYVKGLGTKAAGRIVAEREARGAYRSLQDFLRRLDLAPAKAERLIEAGCFDSLGRGRRELLWELGLVPGAETLRAGGKGGEARQLPLPLSIEAPSVSLPKMSSLEVIAADYETTGLSAREHILARIRAALPRCILTVEAVGRAKDGAKVRTAGLVVARQRPETAMGVLFLLLEDETGMLNVVVRPHLFELRRAVIRQESMLAVEGRVQKKDGVLSLLAYEVRPLSELVEAPLLKPGAAASHDFC